MERSIPPSSNSRLSAKVGHVNNSGGSAEVHGAGGLRWEETIHAPEKMQNSSAYGKKNTAIRHIACTWRVCSYVWGQFYVECYSFCDYNNICLQDQLAAAKLQLLWWWSVTYQTSLLQGQPATSWHLNSSTQMDSCCLCLLLDYDSLPLISQPRWPKNHPICTQEITIHTLWDSKYLYTWSNGLSYFSRSLREMMVLQVWSTSSQWGIPWSRA